MFVDLLQSSVCTLLDAVSNGRHIRGQHLPEVRSCLFVFIFWYGRRLIRPGNLKAVQTTTKLTGK